MTLRPGRQTVDERIVEHTKRGTTLLQRSCPVALSGGLCVAASPAAPAPPGQPTRCGPDSLGQVTVARSAEDVIAGLAELRAAVALYQEAGRHDAAARHAYVTARLALTGLELERAFASPAQTPNDLRLQYQSIEALGDDVGSLAAAARLSQIPQFQYVTLMTSAIPESIRTGEYADDAVEAFCDSVVTQAESFEQEALAAFTSCAQRAARMAETTDITRLRNISAWSAVCTAALATMYPEKFSPIDEMPADSNDAEAARLQLSIGNYSRSIELLAALPSYDQRNMLGVALRGEQRFVEAKAAYARAIETDPTRPEAYYNLGLLHRSIASAVPDLALAANAYRDAIALLEKSAARATEPRSHEIAQRIALERKTLAQIEAYRRAR